MRKIQVVPPKNPVAYLQLLMVIHNLTEHELKFIDQVCDNDEINASGITLLLEKLALKKLAKLEKLLAEIHILCLHDEDMQETA